MAEKKLRSELFVAIAPFFYKDSQLILAGHTVQAGHPILKGRQSLFRPFVPTHPWPVEGSDVEPASAPESVPAEPEPET